MQVGYVEQSVAADLELLPDGPQGDIAEMRAKHEENQKEWAESQAAELGLVTDRRLVGACPSMLAFYV